MSARDILRCRNVADVQDWWGNRWWLGYGNPGPFRCRVGIHRMTWAVDVGRSWSEPGEPGWECECGEEGFPVRIRLSIWLHERTPLGSIRQRWDEWRHPYGTGPDGYSERCLRHDKPWGHR